MFYDWLPGGWGGRNGRDGCNVTTACFGTGLQSQPVEGQERVSPILTNRVPGPHGFARAGQMAWRRRRAQDHHPGDADRTVISYICDRERAIVWGINGGLPSMPHGLSLRRAGSDRGFVARFSVFRPAARQPGTSFRAPPRAAAVTAIRWNATPRWCGRMSRTIMSRWRAPGTDYGVVLQVDRCGPCGIRH